MKRLIFYLSSSLMFLSACEKSSPVNNSQGGISINYPPPPPPPPNPGTCPITSFSGGVVYLTVPSFSIYLTCFRNFYQSYGAAVSAQDKVYYAGGVDDFWNYGGALDGGVEYDPFSNSLRNFKLSAPRCFLAGAKAGNIILFAGGRQVSGYTTNEPFFNVVDMYEQPSLNHTRYSLSEARCHLASVSAGNLAYFIGGQTQNGYSNKIDIYNSVSQSWQVVNMPRERGYCGAALIGNKIYIAGGKNNTGNLKTVDIYDTQSGTWTTLETPNFHPIASVVAVNDKLIVAGGDGLNSKAADIFNTSTQQWSSKNLSGSRFSITAITANNKLLLLGGASQISGPMPFVESAEIDVYDDISGNWLTGQINRGVCGVMAGTAGSRIVLTGFMWDNTQSNTITNTVIILDP